MFSAGDRVFDRFVVVRTVGSGATGTCYEVSVDDQPLLLKVYGADSMIERSRVRRDLARLSGLSHSGLPRIREVAEAEQMVYMLRELVPGQSLAEVLSRSGPLPLERAASILHDVADALGELHKRGFVHREIKPGHVIVGDSGVKLIDSCWPSGDPDYAPPEAGGSTLLTLRADLWGLGALTVHVLSGAPPSRGGALPGGLPDSLVRMVGKMLATDPKNRPFGTRQVLKVIEPLVAGGERSEARRPAKPPVPSQRPAPGAAPAAPPAPSAPDRAATAARLSEESLSLRADTWQAAEDEIEDPSGLVQLPDDSGVAPLPQAGEEDGIVEPSGLVELPDDSGVAPLPPAPAPEGERALPRSRAATILGFAPGGDAPPPPPPAAPLQEAPVRPPVERPLSETSPYEFPADASLAADHSFSLPNEPVVAEERFGAPAAEEGTPQPAGVAAPIQPFRPLVEPVAEPAPVGAAPSVEDMEAAAARFERESVASAAPAAPSAAASGAARADSAVTERPSIPKGWLVGAGIGLIVLVVLVVAVVALSGEDTRAGFGTPGVPGAVQAPGKLPVGAPAPSTLPSTGAPVAPATAGPAEPAPATSAEPTGTAGTEEAAGDAEEASTGGEETAEEAEGEGADDRTARRQAGRAALRRGDAALARRNFGAAAGAYRDASRLGQGAAGAFGLGRVAMAQSSPGAAVPHLERAVRMAPRSVSYRLLLARAYAATGNRSKATSEWRRVLEIDPDNRTAMQSLGIRPSGSKR